MAQICDISGKRTQAGNNVSHAHNITKRTFNVNLQTKRIYLPELNVWLRLRVATSVLRTIHKHGLLAVLKQAHARGTLAKGLQPLVAAL